MDERYLNLQLFCSNLKIRIGTGVSVQGGIQYELSKDGGVAYVTLYNNGNCFARGAETSLLTLLRVWCDNTFLEGMLRPDFAASWREWNENLRFVYDYQQNYGIPDETNAPEE